MLLEIFGSGRNSSLMADYLVENASENYKVANADDLWAEGTYVYNDSRGKWEGNWEITIKTEVLSLKRMDLSSGWEGTYICERN